MRLHLTFAFITAVLLYFTLRESRPDRFTFPNVIAIAARLAKAPYQPPAKLAPAELQALSVEQLGDIHWLDQYTLWRGEHPHPYPFQIQFWHLGAQYHRPVDIYTVSQRGAHGLSYSPKFFDFGNNHFKDPIPPDLGFAGFRIEYPLNKPEALDEVASFLGASYFRVVSRDQNYGLSCRAVSCNTIVVKGNQTEKEEMPDFTQFWLVEPSGLNATQMEIYALLDSPSLSGAYHFTIRPGAPTVVDVKASLFFRKSVERLGLGQLTSMFLFGENSREGITDTSHPEIHDSDGVLMNTGKGDWIWHPLQAQPCIRENDFSDENPKGFGLFQRDRDFQHYQDTEAKYETRPSAWVQPTGNWGKGAIELLQLNSNDVNTDNVNLLWHPDKVPQPGDRLDLDYTISFPTADGQLPPLAYCTQTFVSTPPPVTTPPPPPKPPKKVTPPPPPVDRQIRGHGKLGYPLAIVLPPVPPPTPVPPEIPKHVAPSLIGPPSPAIEGATHIQFDMTGGEINLPKDVAEIPPDGYPLPIISSEPTGLISTVRLVPISYNNTWRVSFAVKPFPAKADAIELRGQLFLKGKPLSEIWNYTLYRPATPPPAK